jgi:hypothetical protein
LLFSVGVAVALKLSCHVDIVPGETETTPDKNADHLGANLPTRRARAHFKRLSFKILWSAGRPPILKRLSFKILWSAGRPPILKRLSFEIFVERRARSVTI